MVNIVLLITVVYVLTMVGIGYYYRGDADSDSGFLVAGRSIGPWIGGGALAVTFMSTASVLGSVGAAQQGGIGFGLFAALGIVTGFVVAMFFHGPRLRNLDVETIPEYFDVRFGILSKRVAALTIGVIMIVYLVAQVRGGALVAQYILGVSYTEGVLIVASVFVIYTLLGGMYAITLTSFIQACILLFAMLLVTVTGIVQIGGLGTFFSQVEQNAGYYFTNAGRTGLGFAVGFGILNFLAVLSMPHIIFRYFAARDSDTARKSAAVGALFSGMFYFVLVLPPALVALMVTGLSNPDNAFLALSEVLFATNGIVLGFIFAAILAAAMSSADAMLVNASSAIVYDLGADIFDKEDEDLSVYVRLVSLLIGVLVTALTLNPPGLILMIVILAIGLFAGGFFAPVLFGLWVDDRSDYAGAASIISGIATVFAVHPETGVILQSLPSPMAGIIGVGVSSVVFFLVNYVSEPTSTGTAVTSD